MTRARLTSWVDWERIWDFCPMRILQLPGEKEQNLTIRIKSLPRKNASNTPLEENGTLTVRLRCQMMIITYVSTTNEVLGCLVRVGGLQDKKAVYKNRHSYEIAIVFPVKTCV